MLYFELFGLPVSFQLDVKQVRKRYLELSRESHPDFHSLSGEEKQAAVLERSTLVTNAYNVLSDDEKRMKYILQEKGMLGDEARVQLRPEFLMEMMDLNEAADMAEGEEEKEALRKRVEETRAELLSIAQPHLDAFDKTGDETALPEVVDFYHKQRYLVRLLEQLL
jgi:molecular chaperone HscB